MQLTVTLKALIEAEDQKDSQEEKDIVCLEGVNQMPENHTSKATGCWDRSPTPPP